MIAELRPDDQAKPWHRVLYLQVLLTVPGVPVESLALLAGIDRFMSQCRSLTNLIGNGVATVIIRRLEKEVPKETIQARLRSAATDGSGI